MGKKLYVIVLVSVALALLVGACSMPASRAPRATNTPQGGDLPFAVPTNSDLVNQILSATQTAIAAGAAPQPTAADAQPTSDSQAGGGIATQAPAATEQQTGGGAPEQSAAQPSGGAQPIPATPQTPATYTLKKGEFPFCIARRYNVSAGDLLSLNGLSTSTQVQPGLTLKIPTSGSWSNGSRSLLAHPTTTSVATGDTFYSIACKYGDVHPESIAAANGMNVGDNLSAGQTINIP